MKVDDLKSRVLSVIRSKPLTVRQIKRKVNAKYGRLYGYTTIGTILQRLESDGMIKSEISNADKRNQKLFTISKNAHRQEVSRLLRSLFFKFGSSGIRHLGEILDTEITDDEIQTIFDKLDL